MTTAAFCRTGFVVFAVCAATFARVARADVPPPQPQACDVRTFADVCVDETTLRACLVGGDGDSFDGTVLDRDCSQFGQICCIVKTGTPPDYGCTQEHPAGGCPSPGSEEEEDGGGCAGGPATGLMALLGLVAITARFSSTRKAR